MSAKELFEKNKKLKEEYITLEKDYGTCELENSKIRDKIKELEEENQILKAEVDLLNDNRHFLNNKIGKAVEYINKFESIKAYFEYTDEDGYDEYDYDDNFRNDILKILKGEENENN